MGYASWHLVVGFYYLFILPFEYGVSRESCISNDIIYLPARLYNIIVFACQIWNHLLMTAGSYSIVFKKSSSQPGKINILFYHLPIYKENILQNLLGTWWCIRLLMLFFLELN